MFDVFALVVGGEIIRIKTDWCGTALAKGEGILVLIGDAKKPRVECGEYKHDINVEGLENYHAIPLLVELLNHVQIYGISPRIAEICDSFKPIKEMKVESNYGLNDDGRRIQLENVQIEYSFDPDLGYSQLEISFSGATLHVGLQRGNDIRIELYAHIIAHAIRKYGAYEPTEDGYYNLNEVGITELFSDLFRV